MIRTTTLMPVAFPAADVPDRYGLLPGAHCAGGGVCPTTDSAVAAVAGQGDLLTAGARHGGTASGCRHGGAMGRIQATGPFINQVHSAPEPGSQPDPGRRPSGTTGLAAVGSSLPATAATTTVRYEKYDPGSAVWRPPV